MQSLVILGRQPELGLAELESLYGQDKVKSLNNLAAIVDVDPCLFAYDRLGGSLKFCKVLTQLSSVELKDIQDFLIKVSPDHSRKMPPGKMTLGLSYYGFNVTPKEIINTGHNIKKAVVKTGRSVRFVPNKETFLNSAQVIHNKLVKENGWELILVKYANKTIVAQTIKVQAIDATPGEIEIGPKEL